MQSRLIQSVNQRHSRAKAETNATKNYKLVNTNLNHLLNVKCVVNIALTGALVIIARGLFTFVPGLVDGMALQGCVNGNYKVTISCRIGFGSMEN